MTVAPNTEAWEAWKSSPPASAGAGAPETERLRADVDFWLL